MTVPAALPVSGGGGDVTFDCIETALSLPLVRSGWEGCRRTRGSGAALSLCDGACARASVLECISVCE